jgi:hypothetical protein
MHYTARGQHAGCRRPHVHLLVWECYAVFLLALADKGWKRAREEDAYLLAG